MYPERAACYWMSQVSSSLVFIELISMLISGILYKTRATQVHGSKMTIESHLMLLHILIYNDIDVHNELVMMFSHLCVSDSLGDLLQLRPKIRINTRLHYAQDQH